MCDKIAMSCPKLCLTCDGFVGDTTGVSFRFIVFEYFIITRALFTWMALVRLGIRINVK